MFSTPLVERVKQATREHRARRRPRVLPHLHEPPALQPPSCETRVVGKEEPRVLAGVPDGRRGEEVGAAGRRDRLHLAARVADRAHALRRQQPHLAVLAALGEEAAAEHDRRRRAEVDVAALELRIVGGVHVPLTWFASPDRRMSESPQFVLPSKRPLPVATSRSPLAGSTTAPERPQIADIVVEQLAGAIRPRRSEQSEFHTCSTLPPAGSTIATWPWYGGASPMYPPVVAIRRPFAKLSADASFSRSGSCVIDTRHDARPVRT